MNKLFIYYSLTGNGDCVAEYLKNNYDIRKIETKETLPKNYILRILAGGYKAMVNYEDKLSNFDKDVSKYDEVLIGTPIWNDRLSSPINTVLKEINLSDKVVKFIFYSGKGNAKKATKVINQKYGNIEIINLKEPIKNKIELKKLEKIVK